MGGRRLERLRLARLARLPMVAVVSRPAAAPTGSTRRTGCGDGIPGGTWRGDAGLPPPDAPAIYVGAPQGQIGPITLDALLQQVAGGQLPPDAPVWFDGLPNWIRMHEHAELRERLATLRPGGCGTRGSPS